MASSKPTSDKTADKAPSVLDPKIQLAKYLKANEDEHYDLTERAAPYRVSSGSLSLDVEIGGFRAGCHRVSGGPNLGKTPFVLNVMDNFLDTVPNSRVIWCMSEGRLSEENAARARHRIVYSAAEWDVGTIYIHRCNVYEVWIGMMRELVTNNPTGCRYTFVTDSLDSMNLRNDLVKSIDEGNKVAGAPLLTKQMFQKIGLAMTERGHMCFFIGQKSAEIRIDPKSPTQPRQTAGSGGNAAAHFAQEALEFQEYWEGALILENPDERLHRTNNKALGHLLKIKLKKSSKEKRYVEVEIPIRYGQTGGNSIWREREVGDAMLGWGLVTKTNPNPPEAKKGKETKEGEAPKKASGSWLYLAPQLVAELAEKGLPELPASINGMKQLYAELEANPAVTNYLFEQFKARVAKV